MGGAVGKRNARSGAIMMLPAARRQTCRQGQQAGGTDGYSGAPERAACRQWPWALLPQADGRAGREDNEQCSTAHPPSARANGFRFNGSEDASPPSQPWAQGRNTVSHPARAGSPGKRQDREGTAARKVGLAAWGVGVGGGGPATSRPPLPRRSVQNPSTALLTSTFTATRRFCALPSSVSLLASGSDSAMPVGVSTRQGFQRQACWR